MTSDADRVRLHLLGKVAHHFAAPRRPRAARRRTSRIAASHVRLGQRAAPREAVENAAEAVPTDCRTSRLRPHPEEPADDGHPEGWKTCSVLASSCETRTLCAPQHEGLLQTHLSQTDMTPEGALRCRTVASGLMGRSADWHYGSCESGRNLGWAPPGSQGNRACPRKSPPWGRC